MKIKEVKIKNFRGYGENPYCEDGFYTFKNLDKYDIVILTGFNGNGKTSFYEAIEWCLTGNIKRIKKIMKDINMKIRKSSCHLIFNDCNGVTRDEAIVEIEFDNAFRLIRKTNSSSLHDYKDTVILYKNGQEYHSKQAIKELMLDLTERYIEIDNVYKSIALGQETLAMFMRDEKDKERKKDLLDLFNLEEFNNIRDKASSDNFAQLNSISYKSKILEINELKEYVNKIFKSCGFTIEEYLSNIGQSYKLLKEKYDDEIQYKLDKNNLTCNLGFINYLNNKTKQLFISIDKLTTSNNNTLKYLCCRKYIENLQLKKSVYELELLKNENLEMKTLSLNRKSQKYKYYSEYFEGVKNKLHEIKIKLDKIFLDDNFYYLDDSNIELIYSYLNKFEGLNTEEECNEVKLINYEYKLENKLIDEEITKNNTELNQLTKIGTDYNEALDKIKNYIVNNAIDKCPVCGNEQIKGYSENISENSTVKEKILDIIDNTIAKNDTEIKMKIKYLDGVRIKRDQLESKYINEIYKNLKTINSYLIEEINTKIIKIERLSKATENYVNKLEEKTNNIKLKIEKYNMLQGKIDDKFINTDIIENRHKLLANIIKMKFNLYTEEEINNACRLYANNEDFYRKEFKIIKQNKDVIKKKSSLVKLIKEYTEKYDIADVNIEQIKMFDEYSQMESKYIDLQKKVDIYKEDRKRIYELFNKKSDELLVKKLNQYKGLGNYIYRCISPHQFYNEFDFVDRQGGTEITLKGNADINLNHIFSNAQVNILALSIFLGIGLLNNRINIEQLFIDDPIQSMDDINILAFIDILRTIAKSKEVNKQLIISTHNVDFASLLKIKLRNLSYKEIKFTYYGKEGPLLEQ